MLFQLAYAEIIFESTYWPAYNEKKFLKNLSEYASRQRRFGTISEN
jgi:undecaprenyl diphosphate synthase